MYTELFNPLYGTVDGLPAIAVGVIVDSGEGGPIQPGMRWVVVDGDGMITFVKPRDFVVDTRFVDGQWHDTTPGALDASE